METGPLPRGGRRGEVLATSELTLEVKLCLQDRTIGRLLAALSSLHSTKQPSCQDLECESQHEAIDKRSDQVQAFVKSPVNGGHGEVDLRKCTFWLGGASNGTDLSMRNATECLPTDDPIEVVVRAGDQL